MGNIRRIRLAKSKTVDIEGKYKTVVEDGKDYPLQLTNYGIKKGKDLELIDGKMSSIGLTDFGDIAQVTNLLYVSLIGATPGIENEITIDEFSMLVSHYTPDELSFKAMQIVLKDTPDDYDEFLKTLDEYIEKELAIEELKNKEPDVDPGKAKRKKK